MRHHRDRDLPRHVAQLRDRREEHPLGRLVGRRHLGEPPRGHQERGVRQRARLGHDRREAQAREDVGVVRLRDPVRPATNGHRRKGAARGHDGPSAGPRQDVRRHRLRVRGGVGERQHDGRGARHGHRPDHRLAEHPADARGPQEHVRPELLHHLEQVVARIRVQAHRERLVPRQGGIALVVIQARPSGDHETVRVQHRDPRPGIGLRDPGLRHRHPQEPGDAGARRTGPRKDDPCLRQRAPRRPERRQYPRHRHDGGPLDVVVERADPVAVPLQQADRVVLLEVLPLEDGARVDLADARHEGLHHLVVRLAAQAGIAPAHVERVRQQLRPVRAHVQRDGQRHAGMHAGRGGVDRQLADRDGHAARALVAQAQDPLVVRDHDQADLVTRRVAEDLRDPVHVVRGDPDAAGPAPQVAELLARATHGRRVDHRQQLLEVVQQDLVEERLVAVLERCEADVPLQVVRLAPDVLQLQRHLLVHAHHARREQAADAQVVALLVGEGGALVENGVRQERHAAQGHGGRPGA